MQLCVDSFTPVDLSVSGSDEGGEAAAFAKRILPDVTYLFDRNFVHFGLINRVLEQGSDLVLRLKKDTGFAADHCRLPGPGTLKPKSKAIASARCREAWRSRTGPPPTQQMREVIIDGDDGKPVAADHQPAGPAAHVIASLYRLRWQVESVLPLAHVWAGFEHPISHSRNGVTFQFYVAVIGCLLMHVRTGRRRSTNMPSSFFGQVAAGLTTLEQILPMLKKIEREKELERQRLARKKTAEASWRRTPPQKCPRSNPGDLVPIAPAVDAARPSPPKHLKTQLPASNQNHKLHMSGSTGVIPDSIGWRRLRDWEEQDIWAQLSGRTRRGRPRLRRDLRRDVSFAPKKRFSSRWKDQPRKGYEVDGGGKRPRSSFWSSTRLGVPARNDAG